MSSSDIRIQEEEKQNYQISQRGYSSDQAEKLAKMRKKIHSSDDSESYSSDDEIDDFYYGENEEDEVENEEMDFFNQYQNQFHRKTTKELDLEAENVVKRVNQSAKDKNENVDEKKKFFKNYIKLLV